MSDDRRILKTLSRALSGEGAHVEAGNVFLGLGWKDAGRKPEGAPHTVFQLLNHMSYWQDWAVKWLDGKKPGTPKHASGSWLGGVGPADARQWKQALRRFEKGLEQIDRRSLDGNLLSAQGGKTRLQMLHTIASHNSYHLGQVVFLRQTLGVWPPPSGGLTW